MDIQRYCAYDQLQQLAWHIVIIHPDISTVNPLEYEYQLPAQLSNDKVEALYRLLVHGLTCLHHRSRERTSEGKYLSEEDDNKTALSLLQQVLPLPQYSLGESEIRLYISLQNDYGKEQSFRSKEIIQAGYHKAATTKRILKKFKKMGLLEVKGNRYRGYEYRLSQ